MRSAVNGGYQRIALPRLIAVRLHQPPFDLQPADSREPERVGRYHADLFEQRIVEARQAPLVAARERGHVQLRSMGDVTRRVRERATVGAQREATQLPLSRRDLTDRPTGRRDREQMHVAVGLGKEVERLAVRRPRWATRVQTPVRCQIPCRPPRDGNDADVVLHAAALRTDERDRPAVGRPGGRAALREPRAQGARRTITDREQEQSWIRVVADFLILRRVLLEGDRLAVRGPRRRALTQIAAGELARRATGERHEVEMARPARLARRQVAAFIADDWNRGVDAAVEALRIGAAGDRCGRHAGAPRLFLEAVRLLTPPRICQPLAVP